MAKCDLCPLLNSDKPCRASIDDPAYCRRIAREAGQAPEHQYWTNKLIREADLPARKTNPCSPVCPLIDRPRPANLERELVVARFKEDVSWVNDCPIPVCLYNKCAGWNPIEFGDHVVERWLPNKGREAGTYLHHIVTNYNDLAEWTNFVQGKPHSTDLLGRLSVSYTDSTSLSRHYKLEWPGPNVTDHDLVEWHGGYEVRYGDAHYHGDRTPEENAPWLNLVWSTWFSSAQPQNWHYGYGAEMAVPRHRIQARPLSFWKRALEACLASPHDDKSYWAGNPASGYAFELIWRYLFDDAKKYKVRKPSLPSLATRVKNFASSATAHVLSGMTTATEEVQAQRKAICDACPFQIKDGDRESCSKCGCIGMNLKRSWQSSKCPEGKW